MYLLISCVTVSNYKIGDSSVLERVTLILYHVFMYWLLCSLNHLVVLTF